MTRECDMSLDRLQETLLSLRRAARRQPNGTYTFAHQKDYRPHFIRGMLFRRNRIRQLVKELKNA